MEILKELRERAGLTLRQVEDATRISNSYLSQLENGKIKRPSAQALFLLAKLYSVDVENLLIESGLIKDVSINPVIMNPSIYHRLDDLEKRVKDLEFWHKQFG